MMNDLKKEVLDFVTKFYDPDKTTIEIELADVFGYFGINPKDILDYHKDFVLSEVSAP